MYCEMEDEKNDGDECWNVDVFIRMCYYKNFWRRLWKEDEIKGNWEFKEEWYEGILYIGEDI